MTDFAERYGPWAVVAGASEGVGKAFAWAMATRGINVVLLARRQNALDDVAAAIRADTGVEARAVALDLAEPDGAIAAQATIVYTKFVWLNWTLDFRPTANAMTEKVAQFVETFRRQFNIAKP